MTVIHIDFRKPKDEAAAVPQIVQAMRGLISRKLSETGFHKDTAERVCDHMSRSLTEHLENVTKELTFVVNVNVTSASASPDDVAAAVNQAWHDQVKAQIDAITKAAIAAVTLASYDAITIMARSDQL